MSAICGAVHLGGAPLPEQYRTILRDAFASCRIDRFEEISEPSLFFLCGHQYVTKEAERETMPLCRGEVYCNADAILDNRDELLGKTKQAQDTPDGALLFSVLEQTGEEALLQMHGVFSAMLYDRKTQEVKLFSDAMGFRFVYYTVIGDIVCYASLMAPLLRLLGTYRTNERFLSDYIANDNLIGFFSPDETAVQGVYRTEPGEIVTVTKGGVQKRCYYEPGRDVKTLRLKSDAEYRDAFLALFRTCTEQAVRGQGNIGVLLSGGYDSTSVACLASEMLKERGKILYSYTHVPHRGFVPDMQTGYAPDESETVRQTAAFLGNLQCTFLDSPDMDIWEDHFAHVQRLEFPYKSVENMLWLYEALCRAKEDDVRIMLTGQVGNGTISFNNARQYFAQLLKSGRVIPLYRELNAMHIQFGYSRKRMWKAIWEDVTGKNRMIKTGEQLLEDGYADRTYVKREGAVERMLAKQREMAGFETDSRLYQRLFIPRNALRQIGEFEQKEMLHTGVLKRDPSRERRMVDFCMSLPPDQFTHNGVTRRLITEYMRGIVPDHVLFAKKRGRQSADLQYRISLKQTQTTQALREAYVRFSGNARVDCEKALRHLESKELSGMEPYEIARHFYTVFYLEYCGQLENCRM